MAAGEGSTDAGNGVKMACRDRFRGGGDSAAGAGDAPVAAPGSEACPEPGSEPRPEPGPQPEPERDDAAAQAGAEVYGDSAYGSGEARAAYRDAGHGTVIKPKPCSPPCPAAFTIDDFAVDEEAARSTCPGGITRPMSKTRTATFGAACAGCPCGNGAPPPKTAVP